LLLPQISWSTAQAEAALRLFLERIGHALLFMRTLRTVRVALWEPDAATPRSLAHVRGPSHVYPPVIRVFTCACCPVLCGPIMCLQRIVYLPSLPPLVTPSVVCHCTRCMYQAHVSTESVQPGTAPASALFGLKSCPNRPLPLCLSFFVSLSLSHDHQQIYLRYTLRAQPSSSLRQRKGNWGR
jgi:hypothetical protein